MNDAGDCDGHSARFRVEIGLAVAVVIETHVYRQRASERVRASMRERGSRRRQRKAWSRLTVAHVLQKP